MSFDRLAPHYRWMESVLAGNKLQRCRLAFLSEVLDCRRVLIVGEGPGRFLTAFATAAPEAKIVCVDASSKMLERSRAALNALDVSGTRIQFVHAALPEWEPPADEFDLIVTHFFLDCFPPAQLNEVVSRLASATKSGARWLLADFCEPPRGIARLRAKLALSIAYAFFRVVTNLPAKKLTSPDAS